MTIMVDPTLIMTKRGQDWVSRAVARVSSPPVWCSAAYIDVASRSQGADLRIYKRGGMGFWSSYHHLAPELVASLRPVEGNFDAEMSLRLVRLDPVEARVVLDIWGGASAGLWIFARRPSTFDILVQAGVTLIVRGSDAYQDAFIIATEGFAPDLAEALDRRTRFIAGVPVCRHHDPTLLLYDSGGSSYR